MGFLLIYPPHPLPYKGRGIVGFMRQMIAILATGFGVGLSPVAPGTCGAAVGLGLYWLLRGLPPMAYAAAVIASIALAAWASDGASRMWNEEDPRRVVIDEIAGILVALAFHPPTLLNALLGFALFRIFDIAKPWPIRWIERRLPGGVGIVADDVAAGIYASAALWALAASLTLVGIELR